MTLTRYSVEIVECEDGSVGRIMRVRTVVIAGAVSVGGLCPASLSGFRDHRPVFRGEIRQQGGIDGVSIFGVDRHGWSGTPLYRRNYTATSWGYGKNRRD